ncbi:MAG: decaprenyl-phosphate phosphoribosyltransferase, partial [Chloroflexota bacterium]
MLSALIKSMRPRQWSKNIFVLAAVVFDKKLLNPEAISKSLAGMVLFCLLSSSVYLINDILDAEADRNHPQKRNRPIASGKLPVPVAAAAAVGIILITIPVSFLLSPLFGWIALIYFLVNLAYSTRLKHIPLIDVLIIAAGFVLRVAAGVSLIEVERFSPWLYVVTTLLALYIGFGKRRAELTLLQNDANNHRRVLDGYNLALLDQLITIVSGTTIVAYSLYTFSAPNLPDNHSMMLTIPFVIYGIFRYLYLIQVEQAGGAPEDIVLTDRPLQA